MKCRVDGLQENVLDDCQMQNCIHTCAIMAVAAAVGGNNDSGDGGHNDDHHDYGHDDHEVIVPLNIS